MSQVRTAVAITAWAHAAPGATRRFLTLYGPKGAAQHVVMTNTADWRVIQQRGQLLAFVCAFADCEFGKDEDESDAQWHDRLSRVITGMTARARALLDEASIRP